MPSEKLDLKDSLRVCCNAAKNALQVTIPFIHKSQLSITSHEHFAGVRLDRGRMAGDTVLPVLQFDQPEPVSVSSPEREAETRTGFLLKFVEEWRRSGTRKEKENQNSR